MTAGRLLAAALVAVALAACRAPAVPEADQPDDRPVLLLLTPLPILFAERFGLDQPGSPLLRRLEQRYRVVPIDLADRASLSQGRLLLAVQPRAQTAEALVDWDAWVRAGGRTLLLADPRLEWPSERALGDRLRPPVSFADTGLLRRWGLSLFGPEGEGGAARGMIAGRPVTLVSAGTLGPAGRDSAALPGDRCAIDPGRTLARCVVGQGLATVIADADLVDSDRLGDTGEAGLSAVLAELQRLDR